MFTPAFRLLLILAALVFGLFHLPEDRLLSAVCFTAAVLLVYGHFRYGTVWLSFRALRRGDVGKAKTLLGMIRRPGLLRPQDRACYEWIRGAIALDEGDKAAGIVHLRSALDGPLLLPHNRCAVACMLAEASIDIGDREGAAGFLGTARGLPHREGLDPVIADLEVKLAATAS